MLGSKKIKYQLLFFLFLLGSFHIKILAQTPIKANTIAQDTIPKRKVDSLKIDKDGLETTVVYSAKDSTVTDFIEEKIYLYGEAKVLYGDIDLSSDMILIDQKNQMVMAYGSKDPKDSTGTRIIGRPIFKQKGDKYESDTIKYNIKSQKAIVKAIATKQGEGIVTSEIAKKSEEGSMYFSGSRYSTCNQRHPHWYISAKKIKLVTGKKVVSGAFNLVIADIPTPLGLPFGMFPFTENRRSGIVIPTYGEAAQRGFFLRQGGYYWAMSKYTALEVLGEIYSTGSWGLNVTMPYNKRYYYNGGLSLQYMRTIDRSDLGNQFTATDFWIRWNHRPAQRGKSTFAASVNFGTSSFNRRRDFNPNNQIANTFNSEISYSTSVDLGFTLMTLSAAVRQNQNVRTNEMNVTLPDINIAINRIYPFKGIKSNVVPNFIKKININYQASGGWKLSNRNLNTANTFPFQVVNGADYTDAITRQVNLPDFNGTNLGEIIKFAKFGVTHRIPINTTIKLKHFSLNPSVNYEETWFTQKLDYEWIESQKGVRVDTTKGFTRVYNYSASLSLTTRIYGIFQFGKNKRMQTLRHTLIPTVSLSYQPDFSSPRFEHFRFVQVDTLGRRAFQSRYFGFEPAPSVSVRQSGVINFGLQNIFEAKVKGKSDTAKLQKITLLDNVALNSSYNMSADSMRIAPISVSARTKLFKAVDFNFSGIVNPYRYVILARNENTGQIQQQMINRLTWENGNFGQLENANIALSFDLTPQSYKDKTNQKLNQQEQKNDRNTSQTDRAINDKQDLQYMKQNPNEYVDFDIPWGLQVNYNATYTKRGFDALYISHQLNLNGNVSLTPTWKMTFRSGYDFTQNQMSYTTLDMIKDLHCWEMRFSWVPFGIFQSWNFVINIKSSMLQDLRLTRQRSFYDRIIR